MSGSHAKQATDATCVGELDLLGTAQRKKGVLKGQTDLMKPATANKGRNLILLPTLDRSGIGKQ